MFSGMGARAGGVPPMRKSPPGTGAHAAALWPWGLGRPAGGGGHIPEGLRCAAVERPGLLLCCALPHGNIPRLAASPGFATGAWGDLVLMNPEESVKPA